MQVEFLTTANDTEVSGFLDKLGGTPDGAFVLGYHYPEYRDVLLSVLQPGTTACYFGARDGQGELCGVLPGMIKRVGDLACYNSLPFFGPNVGVLASPQSPDYAQIAQALVETAVGHAREAGALTAAFYGSFVPGGPNSPWPHTANTAVTRVPKFTQYLPLPQDGLPRWPSVRRRNIRKARSAGVEVVTPLEEAHLDRLLQIYAENCRDYGIPQKPDDFVRQLVRLPGDRLSTYAALRGGELVAGLVVVWGPRDASYYLPCGDARCRSLQPGTLLVDAACAEATTRGVRYFNFESSPSRDSGVFRFKREWGSVEADYEIVVARFCLRKQLQSLGQERIAELFPYFYVYPYSELTPVAA